MATESVIEMKTGMVPLTTIHLTSTDATALQQDLQRRRSEAPALFQGMPCLLSLAGVDISADEIRTLVTTIRENGLMVVGVRNCPPFLTAELSALALADFGQSRQVARPADSTPAQTDQTVQATEDSPVAAEPANSNTPASPATKVHQGNVRSGQQLYFDGDLCIIGMVSAGAEVLATGSIHVMGALRGKALAGVKGAPDVVISCTDFDAQLVAIAGQYQLFENDHALIHQPVLIRLEDDQLLIHGAVNKQTAG